jgi:hypothetical protein
MIGFPVGYAETNLATLYAERSHRPGAILCSRSQQSGEKCAGGRKVSIDIIAAVRE